MIGKATETGVNYKSEQIISQARDRLKELGYAINDFVPGYSFSDTLSRFQAANLTPEGRGLSVDGGFGPESARALFGNYVPAGADLISRALAVAASQVGISEVPPGSNRGPQIALILKSVGLGEGYAWCAAFMHWVFEEASRQMNLKNPCPKNAGVLNMWELASYKSSGLKRITALQAKGNPKLVKPGMQFMMKLGPGAGHTGIVEKVLADGKLVTIEGNSNKQGEREGTAVFRQTKRTISSINLGFIEY
jgi:hypothetical protein